MSTKVTSELRFRITILLILWAVICITALPHRSTVLTSKLQSNITVEKIIDQVSNLYL